MNDYLNTRISREEFIRTRGAIRTQKISITGLNLFDYFCKGMYQKEGDSVILEIAEAIKQDGNHERVFRLCNSFIQWLLEDHPDVIVQKYRHTEHIKKHHSRSIKGVISTLRAYIEEFGQIEFSERRFKKTVRIPAILEEDPEPFTKTEIREFIENTTFKRGTLIMTLKDSGMRIGEALQLKKRDVDIESNPVCINISATYTKTGKGRVTYVTRETKTRLKRLLSTLKEDDLVFGSSREIKKALINEEVLFGRLREKLGYTERYESNNRFKKNIHSLRAYCATQLAEVHSEEFAHGFIGHKKYLEQYIRNKERVAELYLRAENALMIYETVEVVDSDERVKKLETEMKNLIKLVERKDLEERELRELEIRRSLL